MEAKEVYGYRDCLEYAGAEVHAYEEFGSYQGEWFAKVTWNGNTFWIRDYFGSCSGCDAFEAEFSWRKEKTDEALKAFAQDYLDNPLNQAEAEEMASKNLQWDMEAESMLAFIKENAIG